MATTKKQDVPSIAKISKWNKRDVKEETDEYLAMFSKRCVSTHSRNFDLQISQSSLIEFICLYFHPNNAVMMPPWMSARRTRLRPPTSTTISSQVRLRSSRVVAVVSSLFL